MKKIFSILLISVFMGIILPQKTQAKVHIGGGGSTTCVGTAGICVIVKGTPYGDITYYGTLTINQ